MRYMILLAMLMTLAGCDKWDCNGDLDGMWQMTEWRDADGAVKATKEDMIFYSFQLQMASFQKHSKLIRTSMKATSEQIYIFDPVKYKGGGHDDIRPMSELATYGVPEDGIFLIRVLTHSTMQLETNSQNILTFRKY